MGSPAGAGEVTILVGASLGDATWVRYVAVPVAILALRLRESDGSWLMLSEEVIGYLLIRSIIWLSR